MDYLYGALSNIPGMIGNDLKKMTIEDSKFLGGDLEHTHLVKGLDYALLQKVYLIKKI